MSICYSLSVRYHTDEAVLISLWWQPEVHYLTVFISYWQNNAALRLRIFCVLCICSESHWNVKHSFSLNSDIKVTEENVKKVWAIVDAKTLRKEDVQKETVYCLNDDDETEVQKDDTIQGMASLCAPWRQREDNGLDSWVTSGPLSFMTWSLTVVLKCEPCRLVECRDCCMRLFVFTCLKKKILFCQ